MHVLPELSKPKHAFGIIPVIILVIVCLALSYLIARGVARSGKNGHEDLHFSKLLH